MPQSPITNHHSPSLPDDVVISVKGLSKKFCRNLRRSMYYGILDLGRNLLGIKPGDTALRAGEFWALSDISLDVKKGEILGIIGSNGSGKSTLLRLLTGIFPPDKGEISIKGRVGALIALGAGFHPHMTGLENTYLNGAILGMSKPEIDEKFSEIIDFADIGDFIHAPVSTYSSGMTVRLGFSIAIHIEPEIMFIDEVLAVGDASFRSRCYEQMMAYMDKGNTICLVSHDLMAIEGICSRAVWVKKGRIQMEGSPQTVIEAYRADQDEQTLGKSGRSVPATSDETGDIVVTKTELLNQEDVVTEHFKFKDRLIVRIHYHAHNLVTEPYFMTYIYSTVTATSLLQANMLRDGGQPKSLEGEGWLDVDFGSLNLLPGVYRIRVMIRKSSTVEYFALREVASFMISSKPHEYGCNGRFASCYTREGMFVPITYSWGKHQKSSQAHNQY